MPDMICTTAQAVQWLENNLRKLYIEVCGKIRFASWQSKYYDIYAVADYAYNIGINGFSILFEKLYLGNIEAASLEFLNGIYARGKPLLGLLLRRISEYNTFNTGNYWAWEKGDPITQDLKDKLLAKNNKNQAPVNMINQFRVEN